ncbi:hypothetical protein U1Q18_051943 [Sarracenia purpurea var. burkii]
MEEEIVVPPPPPPVISPIAKPEKLDLPMRYIINRHGIVLLLVQRIRELLRARELREKLLLNFSKHTLLNLLGRDLHKIERKPCTQSGLYHKTN